MKISICNFKSIKEIRNFEINFTTLLSGVNSSGKTSFIQLLLLLKQTIEKKSINDVLVLNNPYVELGKFNDFIHNHDNTNLLEIEFYFDKNELEKNKIDNSIISLMEPDYCILNIKYSARNDEIILKQLKIDYHFTKNPIKEHQFIEFINVEEFKYQINTNTGIFNEALYLQTLTGEISFVYFIPLTVKINIDNSEISDDENSNKLFVTKNIIIENLDSLKKILENFFTTISYIGPLREKPQSAYDQNTKDNDIGTKGEYTAYFLENEAQNPIHFFEVLLNDEYISFIEKKDTLVNAVKYWLCSIFKLAKDIKTYKNDEKYAIHIVNNSGLEVSIKHVGFGISQILPIIVEGLRMKNNGTLVLEQPEIHLHPKIQSLLFDFLYSLTLQGKKVIIETHSDHLITRMRRRIAEDCNNQLNNKISLMFIEENEQGESMFRCLDFNELGSLSLNYYPKDFVEQTNIEYRAIVKAQANKRKAIAEKGGKK